MPPVAPAQRSGPLIVWLVVGWIVGVAALIFAIYFYVESDRANKVLDQQTRQYSELATPDMLKSEDMDKLRNARSDEKSGMNSSMKLLDVALLQRNNLAKLISNTDDPIAAQTAAANAIKKAKDAGAKVAGDSLGAAVDALVTEVNARKTEAENNKADSEASKQKLAQITAATEAQVNSLTQQLQQVRAEADEANKKMAEATQAQQGSFTQTAEELRKQLEAAQNQINQVNSQNADLGAQIKKQDATIAQLQDKLGEKRVDTSKVMIQQPDGHIIRLPGNGICFIDLGRGDHINPGLTFEVYDKVEGIPPPGDPSTDENLPKGKASIEVISVGDTNSECRITRMSPGAALSEGDLIVNLVYDKNTKYNFLVYGNFDLDQNGVARPQDAEVIKRLITQWGGNVTTELNVNTDFVVLGKEPVIPDRPKDDTDPVAKAKYDQAVADAEAYADISAKARQYRIPILNQNRFLYLVGYYDQAQRQAISEK
jgi:hypothetical protein